MKLTPKQERFVQEYLVDLNATAAAKRAGYSEKNAGKIGPELLGKTRISTASKTLLAELEAALVQLKLENESLSSRAEQAEGDLGLVAAVLEGERERQPPPCAGPPWG